VITIDDYRAQVRAWLADRLPRTEASEAPFAWGAGSDDVSVFHALGFDEERALIDRAVAWQRTKFQNDFAAIAWSVEQGGAGLTDQHQQTFREEEAGFVVPDSHEVVRVTTNLVAPTVRTIGTDEQRHRFIHSFLSGDELCCQLFSEPDAGSDLASVSTKAVRDSTGWVLNGSKVWASGAQFAQWGEALTRTDPAQSKHDGLTMFLVPMDAPGVEVRPIRQISGGSSFNEVFLNDVRIPDELRLGDVGAGWRVALLTLGFERGQSGAKRGVGGSWEQLLALARWVGADSDPIIRQRLVDVYARDLMRALTRRRAEDAVRMGGAPGPEGSIGKLLWSEGMRSMSDVASTLLGPRLVADSGEWGTYAWASHVTGAPGFRIAGGSDEIQRNIIAERILGLPREPHGGGR
jgi:alkylation response protein AidB-like acyl-CoA dehydrogenase